MNRLAMFFAFMILLLAAGNTNAQTCGAGVARSDCPNRPPLPGAITRQLPRGFVVMDYLAGQLTDSGRTDYLVIIHHPVDTEDKPSERVLLIYTARPDGSFRLAARNDAVVLRADGGGISGDPYVDSGYGGLVIKDRYFTVEQGVAAGHHWTYFITFHYDDKSRNWYFHKEIYTNNQPYLNSVIHGSTRSKPPEVTITRADRKHPVPFSNWLPEGWCDPDGGHEKDKACQRH